MQPFETIYIDSMIAACNGGGGPLGHPKVYLNLAGDGKVECPYCSRLFIHQSQRAGEKALSHVEGHVVETPTAHAAREARDGDHPPPAAPAKP
ncbi:MAG: zinc-finger domain-containing protein [Alphaproteobacteria bacterium]|nr:zinc-finger domain-containing protein [Alphaproteobacteria bacterium]